MLTIYISDGSEDESSEDEETPGGSGDHVIPWDQVTEGGKNKQIMGLQRNGKFKSSVNKIMLGIRVVKHMQFHTTRTVARAIDGPDQTQTTNNATKRKDNNRMDLGYFPKVLRMICKTIQKTERCYLVVELLPPSPDICQYLVSLRHTNSDGNKEDMMIAAECDLVDGEPKDLRWCVGIAIKSCVTVVLDDGDGSFIISDERLSLTVKPANLQSQWAAVHFLNGSLQNAIDNEYFENGKSHSWCKSYTKHIADYNENDLNNNWNCNKIQRIRHRKSILDVFDNRKKSIGRVISTTKSLDSATNDHQYLKKRVSVDELQKLILTTVRDIMYKIDMDTATCKSIRSTAEKELGMDLSHMKSFIEEKILFTYGQMDEPSLIRDYLYLGSEWNACNYEELVENGVTHILNVTSEIESCFESSFTYHRINVLDLPTENLLKHWETTHQFIRNCRDTGGKVLVHCQMGVSRSGSTTISYLMREYQQQFQDTLTEVKNKRSCVKPNAGFAKQLQCYENILREHSGSQNIIQILGSVDHLDL